VIPGTAFKQDGKYNKDNKSIAAKEKQNKKTEQDQSKEIVHLCLFL
jgi:hypothetical protein